MKAIVIKKDFQNCPQELLDIGLTEKGQVLVKIYNEYIIWAISRWRNVIFFLVVNDCHIPEWCPSWLFEVSDSKLNSDWVCNFFNPQNSLNRGVEMLIGPDFIASNIENYADMLELAPQSIKQFNIYIKKIM